jgi:5-methylcytosine-specific restriction endonuclease McrA
MNIDVMDKRPGIPKEIERKVLIEAGHRCSIPTCKYPRVEIAHIIPWAESFDNSFENLIALCPNCHDLYDKDKKIDRAPY